MPYAWMIHSIRKMLVDLKDQLENAGDLPGAGVLKMVSKDIYQVIDLEDDIAWLISEGYINQGGNVK